MASSLHAHLSVIAEHIGRYRAEVADLAGDRSVDPDAPVVAALYEAERALHTATRAVEHAKTLAR
ncbi:MAG: hypothetical protein QM733_20105 [Ilumatobacteraceae bacterium]